MTQPLTTEILNAALENLTARRHQIDEQIAEVRRLLGGGRNGASAESKPTGPKHHISAAGKRAIAAAQRRRWAEQKAAAGTGTAKAKRPKRKLSPEGRQAIVDALKKRWAAKRAAASAKKPATKAASKPAKVKAAGGAE
jgi:hypothetical protein